MRPHDLTLRQLQYAVAVAETGRFCRAAERCHVSQPALSVQLAQLEDALGARLFERDRRRVLTTPAGETILARARAVLAGVDALVQAAARFRDPLAGRLRVGVIPTIAPYALPEIAPAVRARFPRLQLLWLEDRTGALVHGLEAGTLDAGLFALEADLGDLEHVLLASDPFLLAAPKQHPLIRARHLRPSDLDGEEVLLLDDGHCLRQQVLSACGRAGAHDSDFRATSLSTLTQMVAGGAGVTLLPALAAPVENRSGTLALRAFDAPAPERTLVLAWRRGSACEPALRALAETLRAAWPRPAKDGRVSDRNPARRPRR